MNIKNSTPAETNLIAGERVALRRWEKEAPCDWKPDTQRPYETVGYVLAGRAIVRIAGKEQTLGVGDCYVVAHDAVHSYKILEEFSAIEAISPPDAH